ncbi:30S ribosome-binding factor RbfA [Rubrobacter aplysinae]|uniref:30S ribosome-binding factor RbfA n=1 Tax=Rubrobacter aplysinae TaxID=909625 RepID=UPI00064BE905|nr:30S ribosome-binding factor RbfA [Rubrobacter aplysinae]
MSASGAGSSRTRKIESQIKEIAGDHLDGLSDPRIQGLVTVTGVQVSPDLAHAKVYYSTLSGGDEREVAEGLQSSAGRLQSAVGSRTRLRRTPRISFEPDPAVEHATRIDEALREVREDAGEDAAGSSE